MRVLLTWLLLSLAALARPVGPQPTLIMPVHFETFLAAGEVQSMVLETDQLLRESSSGLAWLEPLYVPSFHPALPIDCYRTLQGLRLLRREALAALPFIADLPRYSHLVLVVPAEFPGQASLGTVGSESVYCPQATFDATTAWVRPYGSPVGWGEVLLHELGHNFGLVHTGEGCMSPHGGGLFSASCRAALGWP